MIPPEIFLNFTELIHEGPMRCAEQFKGAAEAQTCG